MARTGLSLSDFIRRCIEPQVMPYVQELQNASVGCPAREDPNEWYFQCGEKLVASAQVARLRAEADALDAKAR